VSWTAPPTFVSGAVLTAAQMNILGGDLSFLGAASGTSVLTTQSTTSLTYTNLATAGPAVTLTTGANALVTVGGAIQNGASNDGALMSWAVSGATTIAANDINAAGINAATVTLQFSMSMTSIATGLNAGSNTFTAKYRAVTGSTAFFSDRFLSVIPLP
jgi:hypothetical protein